MILLAWLRTCFCDDAEIEIPQITLPVQLQKPVEQPGCSSHSSLAAAVIDRLCGSRAWAAFVARWHGAVWCCVSPLYLSLVQSGRPHCYLGGSFAGYSASQCPAHTFKSITLGQQGWMCQISAIFTYPATPSIISPSLILSLASSPSLHMLASIISVELFILEPWLDHLWSAHRGQGECILLIC